MHWYYWLFMQGEWPVLLQYPGQGRGTTALSQRVAEMKTLFVERRLPERIGRAGWRLPPEHAPAGGLLRKLAKAVLAILGGSCSAF